MLLVLEWEGVLVDVMAGYHHAHRVAAGQVGWSALDLVRFRAALKKQGPEAQVLPGATPVKVKQYRDALAKLVESEEVLCAMPLMESATVAVRALTRHAALAWVTLGANINSRAEVLQRGGVRALFKDGIALDADPRSRPAQLRTLAGSEKRVVVCGTSEAVIRAAGAADLITAGFSTGISSAARLQQAGADVVYGGLDELAGALGRGAPDLVRAGLLPLPLG